MYQGLSIFVLVFLAVVIFYLLRANVGQALITFYCRVLRD